MLLSLATESGNDHALPPITRTLPQAEHLHRQLRRRIKYLTDHSPVLSGRDVLGQPPTTAHEHAHILPLDLDEDGHLEHILIWAPMGLYQTAQTAIRAVRQTVMKGGVGELEGAFDAAGDLASLRQLSGRLGRFVEQLLGPPEGGSEWVSLTPFIAPRHLKRNGKNTLEGLVCAELASRGLPGAISIEPLSGPGIGATVQGTTAGEEGAGEAPRLSRLMLNRFRHFVRVRRAGPPPPVDRGYAIRLRFAEPTPGPICLGYGSHYGLGLFRTIPASAA